MMQTVKRAAGSDLPGWSRENDAAQRFAKAYPDAGNAVAALCAGEDELEVRKAHGIEASYTYTVVARLAREGRLVPDSILDRPAILLATPGAPRHRNFGRTNDERTWD